MSNRLILQARNSVMSDQELAAIGENALKEREALLRKHPQLESFQKEIERMLFGAGSVENRMTVLALMMESKLIELQKHLMQLSNITSKMAVS
ncbi:MAG: hypothetical protein C4530_05290 [Desulfobacteraceae bacterium]|jgi:hypothetical protein|nr:MAG: hypothetical protein C4530_05290 [Desulfobacteraceae bacterium]